MILVLRMVFAVCLLHQGNADYKIEVVSVSSKVPDIEVTCDDEEGGDTTITFDEDQYDSTFTAEFFRWDDYDEKTIEGEVCNDDYIDYESAEGLMVKILADIIGVDDCPTPAGTYYVEREFQVEGNAFDELLPPGFGSGAIKVTTYHPDDEGKEAVSMYIRISEDN
ncbi:uncharacterized protein LOC107038590 [Diachasma alloeum]|uniref:uncharacterized protein LOC107038590 n=1 Tax=Diachasma alloeum TaxID=454923 RepID=UPI00073843F8|nr:uncharacterized protein LOC107038590 [Diachasma alloeum]